ncbi:hypothetical protein [Enterococcus hailinensis]|uniref:hypothetical protein n=1 Tax=Enterococcus hailinensis TaxID=3238988 RepID=UPI0038B33DD4
MMQILKKVVKKVVKWVLSVKKYYQNEKRTIFKYAAKALLVIVALLFILFAFFSSALENRLVSNIALFLLVMFTLIIMLLTIEITNSIINLFDEWRYERKAKSMMKSYSSWVHKSEFGKTYRLLDYLDKGKLTYLIQQKERIYLEKLGNPKDKREYWNSLVYEKSFEIYHEVILELSKRPLIELKNMLSYIELTPKKNWFIKLIKTIFGGLIIYFVPSTIKDLISLLSETNNNLQISSFIDRFLSLINVNLERILSDGNLLFRFSIIVVYLIIIIFVGLIMYKDTQFDEPHIRDYMKKALTRASEIKENGEGTESF